MLTRLLAAIVGFVLGGPLLIGITAARAQTMEIAPVSITLLPGQRTASLTVTNRGAAPVTVQVRPFGWSEADGTASLADTAALAASPPAAEIAPGQAQSIRLLLRQAPGATEATYRLLVDQLPPAARVDAVRIALRFSIPVFALPDRSAEPDLQWTIQTGAAGAFLVASNRGARHAVITGARLATPGGPVAVRTSAHPYVLPGARVRWPIEPNRFQPGSAGRSVALTVQSNAGTASATAIVDSAAP